MRLSLRFVVPLLLVLAVFAYFAVPLVDRLTLRWFSRDLDMRANLISNTVEEPLQDLLQAGNRRRILQFFTRITQDERLLAIGFCPAQGDPIVTPTFPKEIGCTELERFSAPKGDLLQTSKGPVLVSVRSLVAAGVPETSLDKPALQASLGRLVLVNDMSFIARRSRETREYLFLFFIGLGLTVAFITVFIAQLSWRGWVQGLRGMLRGERVLLPPSGSGLRGFGAPPRELRGQEVIVVSNREPYIHMRRADAIEVWRPASGLVTALEPIMRACSGVWIAHGSGSADRDVVDARDRVGVPPPPDDPAYHLRPV